MTNEELMRRYYAGDDSVLTMLYNKNTGLIRNIAKETAVMYGCVIMDDKHPTKYSVYTKTFCRICAVKERWSLFPACSAGNTTRARQR